MQIYFLRDYPSGVDGEALRSGLLMPQRGSSEHGDIFEREKGSCSDPSRADALIHSLGTPLTVISGYVQLMRRRSQLSDEKLDVSTEKSLTAIEVAVDQMKQIVAEHRSLHPDADGQEPELP